MKKRTHGKPSAIKLLQEAGFYPDKGLKAIRLWTDSIWDEVVHNIIICGEPSNPKLFLEEQGFPNPTEWVSELVERCSPVDAYDVITLWTNLRCWQNDECEEASKLFGGNTLYKITGGIYSATHQMIRAVLTYVR